MRIFSVAVCLAAAVTAAACKKNDSQGDSAGFLEGASAEAKDALASPVSFSLNEDNFAKWEIAEANLDRIPASEFADAKPSGGTAVERAIARLEGTPRAKRAIEAAGLSVRDFVMETIALAQAVQASQTGRSTVASGVAEGNFAFVERYRDRIRRSGLETGLARQSGDIEITDPNTAAELRAAEENRLADSSSRASDTAAESRGAPSTRDSSRDSLRDTLQLRQP